MALATNLTLLMFLTSDLVPNGSPGLCIETLASTRIAPSETEKYNKYKIFGLIRKSKVKGKSSP